MGFILYKNILGVLNTDKIYKGIYIENEYVSGLTKTQAYLKIKQKFLEPLENQKITINIKEDKKEITFKELEVALNIKEAIDKAYSIGRKGNIIERFNQIKKVYEHPINIRLTYNYNKEKVNQFSERIAKIYYKPSTNATIQKVGALFRITNENYGEVLDTKKLINDILKILDTKKSGEVTITFRKIRPSVRKEDLEKISDCLGEFTTKFDPTNIPRTENVKIAASKINGSLILPNEIFSLSETIGPVTIENGFKVAKVIVNNEFVDGVGGGLCQIASTLYNAVLLSQLQVIERRNHSAEVTYVPLGRDATVASGSIDFKFKNNTDTAIYLESYCNKNTITIKLYGKNEHIGESIKFETEIVEKIPYKTVTEEDPTLPKGTKKLKGPPHYGYKVKTYMLKYKDGKLLSKKLVSYDYYKPVDAIYLIGTKKISKENSTSGSLVTERRQ